MTTPDTLRVEEVLLGEIFIDDSFNTRGQINPIGVRDLANDIEKQGLISPVTVQTYHNPEKPQYKYRLLAGFRRAMAHRILKRDKIVANIRTRELSDVDALYLNISENLIREDLGILQEARALERLKEMGCTLNEMANRLGKSIGWVQPRMMLLNLPEIIQQEVDSGVLSQRHIHELHAIKKNAGPERAIEAAKELKQKIQAGKKNASADMKRIRTDTKFKRTQHDISILQEHIFDTFSGCIMTAIIGWVTGNLSNDELFAAIEEYADHEGIPYKRPSYNLWNRESALVGRLLDEEG